MSTAPHWKRFTPEDVLVLSLAFDDLCELTGITSPSEKLSSRFAEIIVAVARSGERDPLTLAHSAMRVLGNSASYSQTQSPLPAHV